MAENVAIHVAAKYVEFRSGADSELAGAVMPVMQVQSFQPVLQGQSLQPAIQGQSFQPGMQVQ